MTALLNCTKRLSPITFYRHHDTHPHHHQTLAPKKSAVDGILNQLSKPGSFMVSGRASGLIRRRNAISRTE